jgi:hypothetical protein
VTTGNFFIGWGYRIKTVGRIYLNGQHFANVYQQPADWGEQAGKWCFNRDTLAFETNAPDMEAKDTPEEILNELQAWYNAGCSAHLFEK